MSLRLDRRSFLLGTAATGVGLGLGVRSAAADDITITIGVEAGAPNGVFYQKMAPEFTKATGIKTKFIGLPHDDMHQQFLLDAVGGVGSFDVYMADQPWIPEFASKGFLIGLDDKIDAATKADFSAAALSTSSYDGKLYALPFLVHNVCMYYRTDLFEKAGIKAPPTTWDEYRQMAKQLTDKSAGIYGTLIEGKQEGEVATRMQAFIQEAGGDILDASGKVTVNSPAALKALQFMLAVQGDGSIPPGLTNITDMQGMFLDGKLAMAPNWPYMYSLAIDPTQSKVVDKFDVAIMPGDPKQGGIIYSWGYCAAQASKNPDAAVAWVKWAGSPEILAAYGKALISPVPSKKALDIVNADTSLTAKEKSAISTFAKSAAMSTTMQMIPQYPALQDALAVLASSVMSKSQSPQDALAAAQSTMESVMAG